MRSVEKQKRLDCIHILNALSRRLHTSWASAGRDFRFDGASFVCFARALLADPRLLILPEATSSTDKRSEAGLQWALEALLAGARASPSPTGAAGSVTPTSCSGSIGGA